MRWVLVIATAIVVVLSVMFGGDDTRSATRRTNGEGASTQDVVERSLPSADETPKHRVAGQDLPRRRIEVRVQGLRDAPVRLALVRCVFDDNELTRAETDDSGRAWLDAPNAGRIAVTKSQPFPPALSEPIGERSVVTVQLAGGTLAIAGRVVDELGNAERALVAAKVVPEPWMGKWHWVGNHVNRPDGQFRIEGLLPGRYRLVIRAQGAPDVGLIEAGNESVEIRLKPRCMVTVKHVNRATGEALLGFREVWDGEKPFASGAGVLPLPVVPGTTLRWHSTAEGFHPTKPVAIEIGLDERARTLTFEMDPDPGSMVPLTLVIRGSDGSAIPKLQIMRVHRKGYETGTQHKAKNGAYELTLPIGRNELRFGPFSRRKTDGPYPIVYRAWTLKRGERRTEEVILPVGGWLRRPARGAKVRPETPEKFVYFARGDYRMLLMPGRYTVTEPGPDKTELSCEVVIEAGETHEVTLR